METTKRSVAVIVCCLTLVSACEVLAQDWPQWRGPNRDGKLTGFTPPQTWPKALSRKWQTTVGLGDATPALVGDRLYVFARQGSDEVTLCLDAKSGKEVWRHKYQAQIVTGPASRHAGPRSSPAVAGDKVVTLGVGGVLSCLDVASGKELWRKDEFPKVVPPFFAATSPIIVDGMCVAQLGGARDGAIMAFDLATGNQKWKWSGDAPAYASPVLMTAAGTKQIVAQNAKSLVGLAVGDGKLLWQVSTPTRGRACCAATPVVHGQTVIYTGQGRGTTAVKIEKQGDGFAAREIWSNEDTGTSFNTPVLRDGLLFALSDRGNFFCLNAATGQAAWIGGDRVDRFGALLDGGSVILALPTSSELIVLKPSGERYEELTRIKVADAPTYAHPVIAGKKVYVKARETVTMWALE
jgi:outer membrane protein assembly factor BamB